MEEDGFDSIYKTQVSTYMKEFYASNQVTLSMKISFVSLAIIQAVKKVNG